MADAYTLPDENLAFIAQDIGDNLIPYLTMEQRLHGLKCKLTEGEDTRNLVADAPPNTKIRSRNHQLWIDEIAKRTARDVGDQLIPYLTIEQLLRGFSQTELLEAITVGEWMEYARQNPEKSDEVLIWVQLKMICRKQSAEGRIAWMERLEPFSETKFTMILDEKYRDWLLSGLNATEQKKLSEWIENYV